MQVHALFQTKSKAHAAFKININGVSCVHNEPSLARK